MYAVVGTLLLAAATIMLSVAFVLYRRPNPGSWTSWEWLQEAVVVTNLGLFALGAGFLFQFIGTLSSIAVEGIEVATVLATLVVAGFVLASIRSWWRRLNSASQVVSAATADAPTPTRPANDPDPARPPRPRHSGGKSGGGQRRAA